MSGTNLQALKHQIVEAIRRKNFGTDEIKAVKALYTDTNFNDDKIYPDFTIPTYAAYCDVAEIVPLLQELKVDLTTPDEHFQSPAITASAHGSRRFVEALHVAGIDLLKPVGNVNTLIAAHDRETRVYIASLVADQVDKILIPRMEEAVTLVYPSGKYKTHELVAHFETFIKDIKTLQALASVDKKYDAEMQRLRELAVKKDNRFALAEIDKVLLPKPAQTAAPNTPVFD